MKNRAQDLPLCLSVLPKKFQESVCAVCIQKGIVTQGRKKKMKCMHECNPQFAQRKERRDLLRVNSVVG
jgi:hypothetical protein